MFFQITYSLSLLLFANLMLKFSFTQSIGLHFCSFQRFEYPPIFHRDEDTNLDELRVSVLLLRTPFFIDCCLLYTCIHRCTGKKWPFAILHQICLIVMFAHTKLLEKEKLWPYVHVTSWAKRSTMFLQNIFSYCSKISHTSMIAERLVQFDPWS